MDDSLSRNIPAITPEEQALLNSKRVLLVGCGGLGGHLAEYLARLGVGCIRAVDGDSFSPGNLNRQLLCTTQTLGMNKARAAAQRLALAAPATAVEPVELYLTADNAPALLSGCDAVLDALDSVPARLLLERACAEAGLPLFHGAIREWCAQAAVIPPGSGLLARLYGQSDPAPAPAVLSFTAGLCAAMQAAECAKYLCSRPVSLWGRLWLWDGLTQESHILPLE